MPRSPRLIIDSETGEPKPLPPAYYKYPAWRVMVKDLEKGGRWSAPFYSYKKAKKAEKKMVKMYGDRVETCVVSMRFGWGPPYSRITDLQLLGLNENRQYWCPYCRTIRQFLWLPIKDERCCTMCHVRQSDFHVKVNNPIMWDREKVRAVRYGEPI